MAEQYFIAKVYKQHRSLCVAIPKAVCIALDIRRSNYMVFTWNNKEGKFDLKKFQPVGAKSGPDTGNTDSRD